MRCFQKKHDRHASGVRMPKLSWTIKSPAEVDNAAGIDANLGDLAMEQFEDELPVVTLMRIIEEVQDRQSGLKGPQVIVAVKEQFAKQYPGATFPWNEAFVLEVWRQSSDSNS